MLVALGFDVFGPGQCRGCFGGGFEQEMTFKTEKRLPIGETTGVTRHITDKQAPLRAGMALSCVLVLFCRRPANPKYTPGPSVSQVVTDQILPPRTHVTGV